MSFGGFFRILMIVIAGVAATVIVSEIIKRHFVGATAFEYTVSVCRGEHERYCRPHKFFIGCGSVTEWAQRRCPEFTIIDSSDAPGGKCRYVIADVTCRLRTR